MIFSRPILFVPLVTIMFVTVITGQLVADKPDEAVGSEEKSGGAIRAGSVIAFEDPVDLFAGATSRIVFAVVIFLRPVYLKWCRHILKEQSLIRPG